LLCHNYSLFIFAGIVRGVTVAATVFPVCVVIPAVFAPVASPVVPSSILVAAAITAVPAAVIPPIVTPVIAAAIVEASTPTGSCDWFYIAFRFV
jgi:hypothetical protein